MKILAGLKFQRRKPVAAPKNCGGQRGHESLTVQISDYGEGYGSHRGYSGAEAVHVIENAEGSGDAYDPDHR